MRSRAKQLLATLAACHHINTHGLCTVALWLRGHNLHNTRRAGDSYAPSPSQVSARTCSTTPESPASRLPASIRLTPALEQQLQRITSRLQHISTILATQHDQPGDTSDVQQQPAGSQAQVFEEAARTKAAAAAGAAGQQGEGRGRALDMARLLQEYGALQHTAEQYAQYQAMRGEIEGVAGLLADPDPAVVTLAKEESQTLRTKLRQLEEALLLGLLPNRSLDDSQRGAILEVRAGAGGAEASLFAAELLHMYLQFAASKGWQSEVLEASESEAGGYRSASAAVTGPGAYNTLRWEAGVHRVQRVPTTEAMGRLHTSTAAVTVLPQASEVEVVLREEELRIEAFRASGAGGQHVNTTSSAVRIVHLPTNTVVTCQDERSQIRNRAKALQVLRARLFAMEQRRAEAATTEQRRAQVASSERNERIRTYNFQQDRLTDHRVALTHHGLEAILSGHRTDTLDAIHDTLALAEQVQQLEDLVGSGTD